MQRSVIAATCVAIITLSGCVGQPDANSSSSAQAITQAGNSEVVVLTHDSFAIPDDVLARFEAETGLEVTFVAPGDAGSLVNQLILTKDSPLGDVAYGVDNTFASRAIAEGVFEDYVSTVEGAQDSAAFSLDGDKGLTAIDYSDVCLNIDLASFDAELPAPETLDDLLDPRYRGMVSVPNPATSSPGLAFLLATIAAKGDQWPEYWTRLKENDLRVTASWSDSYYVDFSAPSVGGDYPIVLSYASSPPYEVANGKATTRALLDTCFRQVEYAGVLNGAKNPGGARAVIDWMLSDDFQSALPTSMYVYPVSRSVSIPEDWQRYAPLADKPWELDAKDVDANRDAWIMTWTETVLD